METLEKNPKWNRVSEIELTYRNKVKASERPQIQSSRQAYELLVEIWDANRIEFVEQFQILLLNQSHRVLGFCEMFTGGIAGTVVDIRLIFATALKANATGIILAHNHPSGNLKPSQEDINITKRISNAAVLLDIKILDHIIVTSEDYYSFADAGVL